MSSDVCTTMVCNRPNEAFLKSFLGENVVVSGINSVTISSGIQLYVADVVLNPQSSNADEEAVLHLYPVADNNYYLQLSFLPERQNTEVELCKVIQLVFAPAFFAQWSQELIATKQPFAIDRSTEQAFSIAPQIRDLLDSLLSTPAKDDLINALKKQESALAILRFALAAFIQPDEANVLPACSFLAHNSERSKVTQAQQLIMNSLEEPYTIRALSREVGMNECYLKKGFKAMYGKTIHEYQQYQRIEKAKELLAKGIYSVNEVAFKLGFGSPSHFSTTFKRIAGIKPCELLR